MGHPEIYPTLVGYAGRQLGRSVIGLAAVLLGLACWTAAGQAVEVFPAVHMEPITVRVLDGKSGEPLAQAHLTLLGGYDEHDLKLGMWREEELTNQKGELRLANGLANLPYLQVWVGQHQVCHGSPGKARFNVARIRNEGLSAPNRCATYVIEDKPGIFTVFVKGKGPAKDAAAKTKAAGGTTAAHSTAIVYAPVPINSIGSLVAAGSAVSLAAGKAVSEAMLASGSASRPAREAETGTAVDFPPVSRKASESTKEWMDALGMGTSEIPSPSPVEFWMPGAAPPVTTHRRTTAKQNGQRGKLKAAGPEKVKAAPAKAASPAKAGDDGKQAAKAQAGSAGKTNAAAAAAKAGVTPAAKAGVGTAAKADAGAAAKTTVPVKTVATKPADKPAPSAGDKSAAAGAKPAAAKAGAATDKPDPAAKTSKPAHASKPSAGHAAETKSTKKSAAPAAAVCPPSQKP